MTEESHASDVRRAVFAFLRAKGPIPGSTEAEQLAYPYLEQGLLDSLGVVEMVTEFEGTFGIQFTLDDLQGLEFRTVGGLIGIIERLRTEQQAV
jgi:acyl carrier protein